MATVRDSTEGNDCRRAASTPPSQTSAAAQPGFFESRRRYVSPLNAHLIGSDGVDGAGSCAGNGLVPHTRREEFVAFDCTTYPTQSREHFVKMARQLFGGLEPNLRSQLLHAYRAFQVKHQQPGTFASKADIDTVRKGYKRPRRTRGENACATFVATIRSDRNTFRNRMENEWIYQTTACKRLGKFKKRLDKRT